MNPEEAIELIPDVKKWNRLWKAKKNKLFLHNVDLGQAHLPDINLSRVHLVKADLFEADLSKANLHETFLNVADLREANLSEADLTGAVLSSAYLGGANLSRADLSGACLEDANVTQANLTAANLTEAELMGADLGGANLREANLTGAQLTYANLRSCDLRGTDLTNAVVGWTIFGDVDLTSTIGLETVNHLGPSTVGVDTLFKSEGKLPIAFLRGCGFSPWQIEFSRLHNPRLSDGEIAELLSTKLFEARSKGPLYIGGVFISYSRADASFVDKIYKQLYDEGASVWLDRHDTVAGDLQKQIGRAIRLNDVVLLVLSKSSVKSDWVEAELEMARKKEKEEKREVLCPLALDDSWKGKVEGDVLWRQLTKKNILDFSGWKTKKFGPQFKRLVKGMKIYY